MSTNPHYNIAFCQPFWEYGYDVVYQPCCLINNYDQRCWPIQYPQVTWTDRTIVIMHTQDFLSIHNDTCPELEAMDQHFGEHADRVVVIHWNIDLARVYNGKMHLVYFPTHSYELMNNLCDNRSEWESNFERVRCHSWQCLNGIPRHHRRLVAEYLLENYSNGILSLAEEIPLPEWSYNTYFGCENETNWQRLSPVYTDCCTNIVTETMYYDAPGIITEKTLFAFLAGQLPILIGYAGIVDHCESLGFDMFRDIVDTSYDYAHNHDRWQLAIDLNKKLLFSCPMPWITERLLANREHALVTFPQNMLSNYRDRCSEIHSDLANR